MTSNLRTVYVERETAAALAADATRRGVHIAEVYRQHFPDVALPFRVRVVNIDERLRELIAQGMPWPEAVQRAFEAAP